MRPIPPLYLAAAFLVAPLAVAQPNQTGQTGFIQMPSGRVEADGTLQFGLSAEPAYQSLWANIAFLPWLELSSRFTRIQNVDGGLGAAYGDYKDKAFDGKLRLLPEGVYHPSIVFGLQDFVGTGVFEARYLAAAKRFGPLDLSVGYGQQRIDGWFGGLRYDVPSVEGLSLVAEYNAFDYKRDLASSTSGVDQRDKGVGLGLEYRWGWLGSQLSWQDGRWGMNAYVSVPLQAADFIPKFDEPKPYMEAHEQVTDEEWNRNPDHQRALLLALSSQDFLRIGVGYKEGVLRLRLSNGRISHMARAIGRAARTAVALGPRDAAKIEIVYTQAGLPVATVTFNDVATLNAYYQGLVGADVLLETVDSRYGNTNDVRGLVDADVLLAGLREGPKLSTTAASDSGHWFAFEGKNSVWYDNVGVAPRLAFFFNDPSGALHYEVMLEAGWAKQFSSGLMVDTLVGYTVATDVDEVKQDSNSLLPHVRSDVSRYRRGGDLKLTRLVMNQIWPLGERTFARFGAGLYEEMFGGAGVQGLYVWPGSRFAVDVSVDAVKQRDYSRPFEFLEYDTVTSLVSLHWRLPYGLTTTARAGRFLAGDDGIRFEFKRRFRSGYEIGAWYTRTNANDITTPGAPGSPYQDKGIYFSVPLNTLLTKDTSAEGSYRLRPWTRDGGQMVAPSLDLYEVIEKPVMLDFPELRQKFQELGHQ